MDSYSIIVWLLPVVFMVHDFEEIIFLRPWITKNRELLTQKFPSISKRFFAYFNGVTTTSFTVAVAEEFVVLSLATFISAAFSCYLLWLAMFMGFTVHLLVHVVQWIAIKRYIPAIYTTFLALVYAAYSLYTIAVNGIFSAIDIIICTIAGCGVVALNLVLAHKLGAKIDKMYCS